MLCNVKTLKCSMDHCPPLRRAMNPRTAHVATIAIATNRTIAIPSPAPNLRAALAGGVRKEKKAKRKGTTYRGSISDSSSTPLGYKG